MVNVDFEKFRVRLILLLLGALLAMFGSDVIHLKVSTQFLDFIKGNDQNIYNFELLI